MLRFFDTFRTRPSFSARRSGRSYQCRCKRPVFFSNSVCLGCNTALGYEPDLAKVFPIEPIPGGDGWRIAEDIEGASPVYRRCANLYTPAGCNWLLSDLNNLGVTEGLCVACRLNRTIPDLSVPENGILWGKIEAAKRRLVSTLLALEMPVTSRAEDPERGLAFDFLRDREGEPRILTGHANGLITLNIEEARSSTRELIREQMNEPYRTLLGHLRHEVGHYYWDRLIGGTTWIDEFRRLFGDERADYGETMQRYYASGPPLDWPQRFVSAYASSHPFEDWAETWSHILHMADTLGTALSFGLDPRGLDLEVEPFPPTLLYLPDDPGAERFLEFLNSWIALAAVMNEMSRGMGQPDFYPFALPNAAVTKLHFIRVVVNRERARPQTPVAN
jgi:hypothetical protein